MRRPQGYAITTEPDKATIEEDTYTCCHCNCIVFVKANSDPSDMGGFCRMCYSHICSDCADKGTCDPFEKKLEAMERRERFLKSVVG